MGVGRLTCAHELLAHRPVYDARVRLGLASHFACIAPAAAGPRPDRLRAEVARQAMPSSAASGGAGRVGGGAGHGPTRGLEVVAAHYADGVLLLAEAAAGDSRTRLFMLSRCEGGGRGGALAGGGTALEGRSIRRALHCLAG
jgi:hypothetical protein